MIPQVVMLLVIAFGLVVVGYKIDDRRTSPFLATCAIILILIAGTVAARM